MSSENRCYARAPLSTLAFYQKNLRTPIYRQRQVIVNIFRERHNVNRTTQLDLAEQHPNHRSWDIRFFNVMNLYTHITKHLSLSLPFRMCEHDNTTQRRLHNVPVKKVMYTTQTMLLVKQISSSHTARKSACSSFSLDSWLVTCNDTFIMSCKFEGNNIYELTQNRYREKNICRF